ncbi:kinesin-domain-containing protein [Artomyces pyxidatus]|uniref:Kinesin-domain-containing protein n=1 Tax=Artomyces pyxidatus TaxID=48021 RepID=A0ACB8TEY4_9AGAM|nr:kinesin-domain-containing protein [Artomyces pyxidatus]
MASAHKVRIAARLRPPIAGELNDDGVRIVPSDDGLSAICVTNPRDPSQVFKFPFSSCYGHASRQEDIFEKDVRPLIDVVYSGVTVTIFAYGVTSSGKTHTMQGTKSEPGVIPRVVEALFAHRTQMSQYEVSIAASYMEIYKDEVYDLLVDRETAPKLPIREKGNQVFVANLMSVPLKTPQAFETLYTTANKQRSVGSTLLNRASSRSHAVLTLEIQMVDSQEGKTLTGKINLVDLAGSENNKLTGNDPSRMAESAAINKSLSVLGQVVHALNQGASRIPYRNSKLTRILQDALGGSSVGLLICNLAPGLKFRQDTLNTLNFAVRTKNVENKPVINERENLPAPKQHFAAVQPPPAKLAALPLPAGPIAGSSRPSLVPARTITSSSGVPGPSRVPRISAIGSHAPYPNAHKRKESGIGLVQGHLNSLAQAMTDQDIDDRISKAVEAEVARRLEEKMEELERQRTREDEERRAREQAELLAASKDPTPRKETEHDGLPSGLLTPLLKRHQDLDNELRKRLQDLERKYERGNDADFAHGLSPASRKKTGRAYVALARTYSEKGDLQVALDLYRKAETYVPDNIKLKERIIELDWSVSHGKEYKPSPKKPKRTKAKKKSKSARANAKNSDAERASSQPDEPRLDESQDDETVESLLEPIVEMPEPEALGRGKRKKGGPAFGMEVTNSPNKRSGDQDSDAEAAATPPRKLRARKGGKVRAGVSDDEWAPSAPVKKGKAADE